MISLTGKTIIVTGAGQGMGEATADTLVELGAQVIVADVNVALGKDVAERLGRQATFQELDVTQSSNWDRVVAEVLRLNPRIDGLVNNAGIHANGPIEEFEIDMMRALLDVNLVGPWLGMKAVVPSMKANRCGSIVNVSSVEGLSTMCDATVYAATKWGVRGATKALSKEVGPYGVRVNCILPGAIDTPMLRIGMQGMPFGSLFPDVAMNRPGHPREVAASTAFLMSDEAAYISGTDLTVDGGWTSGMYVGNKPVPEPAK